MNTSQICFHGAMMGTPPQRFLHPGSWHWIGYLTWQKGLCKCDWVRTLRWEDYLGLPLWAQCGQHKDFFIRGRREVRFRREVMTEAEVGEMWSWAKDYKQLLEAGRITDSPRGHAERIQLLWPLSCNSVKSILECWPLGLSRIKVVLS